jgi:hypothetical protein
MTRASILLTGPGCSKFEMGFESVVESAMPSDIMGYVPMGDPCDTSLCILDCLHPDCSFLPNISMDLVLSSTIATEIREGRLANEYPAGPREPCDLTIERPIFEGLFESRVEDPESVHFMRTR